MLKGVKKQRRSTTREQEKKSSITIRIIKDLTRVNYIRNGVKKNIRNTKGGKK